MHICRHSWGRCWKNPSDIGRLARLLCHAADSRSPDECQRYDLPLLYWDCLTPPSCLIHPQENPNVLIPRGNIFFFCTICLAMIYWLLLPPLRRITDPFWEITFSHLSWVCMWHRSPEAMRGGGTDFEEQLCLNLCGVAPLLPAVNGFLLWFSDFLPVNHYLQYLVSKYHLISYVFIPSPNHESTPFTHNDHRLAPLRHKQLINKKGK